MKAEEYELLDTALQRWLRRLTPGGYPATAVVRLREELAARWICWNNAKRELAVTALERYAPACKYPATLTLSAALCQRLEAEHRLAARGGSVAARSRCRKQQEAAS